MKTLSQNTERLLNNPKIREAAKTAAISGKAQKVTVTQGTQTRTVTIKPAGKYAR